MFKNRKIRIAVLTVLVLVALSVAAVSVYMATRGTPQNNDDIMSMPSRLFVEAIETGSSEKLHEWAGEFGIDTNGMTDKEIREALRGAKAEQQGDDGRNGSKEK